MKPLLYFTILIFVAASCRKNNSSFTDPSGARTTFAANMNGDRIWMGRASTSGYPPPPDAFTRIPVLALNDRTILILGDTFKYEAFDASSRIINYKYWDYSTVKYLYFNTSDNSMELEWSGKNTGGMISTKNYQYNSSLKDYTPDIDGLKTMTGTAYDTFVMRQPHDSLYTVNTTINFKVINESTIVIYKDFFGINNDTLHYKLTDNAAKTVVYQTFHLQYYQFSTLTYNYDTKSIVLEQDSYTYGWHRYLKLQ